MKCKSAWVMCASVAGLLGEPIWAQVTTRVNVSSSGTQTVGEGGSGGGGATLSADGRFVAFESGATNLVPGGATGMLNVYVRDRHKSTTEIVSLASTGNQSQQASCYLSGMSSDGRYVSFSSFASDLVVGDTNAFMDGFLHDRVAHTTTRVTVSSLGQEGNGDSSGGWISTDGRYVFFNSRASNLVVGDANGSTDIFMHDRWSATTARVSVDASGGEANGDSWLGSVSADGRYMAFASLGSNLVAGDSNGWFDIFVRDILSGVVSRVSVASDGTQANYYSGEPAISADGRYVSFQSNASNLVVGDTNGIADVFVHDRINATTTRINLGPNGIQSNDHCGQASISGDGRFVAFYGRATNLVAFDYNQEEDIFLRDRANNTTELVTIAFNGVTQANDFSYGPSISADGRFVSFSSYATNLVTGDTNGKGDNFVRDLFGCTPENYCTAKVNSAGCTPTIIGIGTPSVTVGKRFLIDAVQVIEHRTGLLFYGVHGPNDAVFQGGFLCVSSPWHRTPGQTARSLGSPPCTGLLALDFNGRIASGIDPALVLGRQVWAQYWMRDPGALFGTGLTDGLTFTIGP